MKELLQYLNVRKEINNNFYMVEQRESLQYTRIAQKSKFIPRTARSFENYKAIFGFRDSDLREKTILDVGAGSSDFSERAAKLAKTAISLDPQYSNKPPRYRSGAVACFAQTLPFRDNTFDETIASVSLFCIKAGLAEVLLEMIRVTKPEGKVRVFPAELKEGKTLQFSDATELVSVNNYRGISPTLVITKIPSHRRSQWSNEVTNILDRIDLHKFNTLM